MKRALVIAVLMMLNGCTVDLPGMVREAAKDHASVHADVECNTIYGRFHVIYDRANPKVPPVTH